MKTNKPIQRPHEPMLRFSPYAWAKLVFMRDCSDNEVGAFGITRPDDLLFVEDIVIVRQTVSIVTVTFEDTAVGDFFEQQVDLGRKPEQFARIWVHSHPGNSPMPSMTDEETFLRVFGSCDWSVMCIIAQGGNSFARLRFGVGPGGDMKIPVSVDYSHEFAGSDFKTWQKEYKQHVKEQLFIAPAKQEILTPGGALDFEKPSILADDVMDQIDRMHPIERQEFMDDLTIHSEFWNAEDWL